MSNATTHSATITDAAHNLAGLYPVQCLAPAVVLAAIGVVFRHVVTRHRPSVFGRDGLVLHHVAPIAALAGIMVGAVALLPLHFSSTVIISSALFSLFAAFIVWGARESISAAFLTVGMMMLSVGAVDLMIAVAGAPWAPLTDPLTGGLGFGSMWVLYALPGIIAAGLAAALSTMPAAEADRIRRAEAAREASQAPDASRRSSPAAA